MTLHSVGGGIAAFVADPADIRTHDGDDGLGLEFADEGVIALPIKALLALAGGGPVEEDLANFAVAGEQFAQLGAEEVVILLVFPAVGGLVQIGGGEIDAKTDAGFVTGFGHLAHQVAFALAPGAVFD